MHKMIRTAALELQATDNKEVVKIAGILGRLKSFFKQLTDSEYAGSVDQLRADSKMLQATADQLKKRIESLNEAIANGDITLYDASLASIRDLTALLSIELKRVNQEARRRNPRKTKSEKDADSIEAPESTVITPAETTPEKKNESSSEKNKNDVLSPPEPGRYNESLKNFKWFDQFSTQDIHLPAGVNSKAHKQLFESIVGLIMRETNLPSKFEENSIEELVKSHWDKIVDSFKQAILNGTLKEYRPASVSKQHSTRPEGQMEMKVYTAPFEFIPGVAGEAFVKLLDLTPSHPSTKKIVVQIVNFGRVTANGVTKDLWTPPVRRKETSVPKREPSLEESPKKSSSNINRLRKLASLLKASGIDPQASKRLPNTFWVSFVQMCGRLGAKPEDLARVINSESGFDPHATNKQGGHIVAKGLNQLIENTAKRLGMTQAEWDHFENTSAEEQLPYVEKFFKMVGKASGQDGRWESAAQLYVANFAPKYISKASNPNTTLYDGGKAYEQNKGLDREGKGFITVKDLSRTVQGPLPAHIAAAIEQAKNTTQSGSLVATNIESKPVNDVDGLLANLFAMGPVEKIVRESILRTVLPTTNVLISVSSLSAPLHERLAFVKAAASTLREIMNAEVVVHGADDKIELSVSACGSMFCVTSAAKELCDLVNRAMDLNVSVVAIPGVTSKFAQIKE